MSRIPEKPVRQPSSFCKVIFSVLKMNAETIIERKTFEAVIIELFIPVVCERPM